jgi:hypothetical protein
MDGIIVDDTKIAVNFALDDDHLFDDHIEPWSEG